MAALASDSVDMCWTQKVHENDHHRNAECLSICRCYVPEIRGRSIAKGLCSRITGGHKIRRFNILKLSLN